MKLLIFVLERRRAFIHLIFCTLYLLLLFPRNWGSDGFSPMKALALLLMGGAGISIAYVMRYVLILSFINWQWKRSLLVLLAHFLGIGILGYLIFHVFDNRMSEEIVHATVKHPWQEYIHYYIYWYPSFAKYAVPFFFGENAIFLAVDSFLYRYWREHVALPGKYPLIHPKDEHGNPRNLLAGHFLNNLVILLYSRLMSGDKMKPAQVSHLASVMNYGRWSYLRDRETWVTLADEVAVVRHFLAVEQDRGIRLCLKGNLQRVMIPSMLLLSIVENMIKHGGAATGEDDAAVLYIRLKGSTLYITSDNRPADRSRWKQQDSGKGLQHIRHLLDRNFGSRATFYTETINNRFYVYLRIDNI